MLDLKPGLRSHQGNLSAPPNVVGEAGLQFVVIREDFLGRFKHQFDPSLLLIRREPQIAVPFKHRTMAAMLLGVAGRAAEDLAEPDRDMLRMLGGEGREHR